MANFISSAGDGWYAGDGPATFATLRAAAQTSSDITTADGLVMGLTFSTTSDVLNYMHRGIFPFDTSALGAAATIISASFNIYVSAKFDTVPNNPGWGIDHYTTAGYALANYDGVRQASDIAHSSIATSSFNSWALNATGLSNINKTGTSQFALRFSHDIDN